MGSSRYPGKSTVPMLGLPLVLHVYERCRLFDRFSEVVVATCDKEIEDAVTAHGGVSVMTSDAHERCTDRVEECISLRYPDMPDDAVIVMVQGDEVLVSPDMIALVVDAQEASGAPVVNLGSRLLRAEDQESADTVKIVAGNNGQALYLSRSVLPSPARGGGNPVYQQTGIMAFTWKFLRTFSGLPQTSLEIAESVDMLRVLEHGIQLNVVFIETETLGVDTPDDKLRGEELLAADPLTQDYMDLPR